LLTVYSDNSFASSTYKPDHLDVFSASRNGHHIQGHRAIETLIVDGVQLPNIQISTVQNSTLKMNGILGLGYASGVSQHGRQEGQAQTFLDNLAKEGTIHHKAYSIHLDKDTETGTILFGGMDTSKFHGSITELPIVPHTDATGHKSYHALQVMIVSLELGKNGSIAYNIAAILDPSSRISHLPKAVFEPLLEKFRNSQPGYPDSHFKEVEVGTQKIHTVDCTIREDVSNENVIFGFGGVEGAKIDVPLSDLVLKAPGCSDERSSTETTPCLCFLAFNQSPMVKSANDSSPFEVTVLGDAILRYAYVVYDLQDNKISMAQKNFEFAKSNIVELGKEAKSLSLPEKEPLTSSAHSPKHAHPASAALVLRPSSVLYPACMVLLSLIVQVGV